MLTRRRLLVVGAAGIAVAALGGCVDEAPEAPAFVLLRTLAGHDGIITSVALSPVGKVLASGGGDNIIKLWDPETGRELRALDGHSVWISSVAFSPDGKLVASGSLGSNHQDLGCGLWL